MKKIVVTLGDPSGIGPYLVTESLARCNLSGMHVVLIGSEKILKRYKAFAKISKYIELINIKFKGTLTYGTPSQISGKLSLTCLQTAVRFLKKNPQFCLVTAPVSKEAIRFVQPNFSGHTEFLADHFQRPKIAMMMVGSRLKLVLLTRHIALRDVGRTLARSSVFDTLRLTEQSLVNHFGIRCPRIGICSVNPHAGLDTFMQEEKILYTAIKKLKTPVKKAVYIGPYPADMILARAWKKEFDAVLCAYHDQAMILFRTLEFHQGVNLTLGLGFIRTSPAHGPAFGLFGKHKLIDTRPMQQAMKLALKLQNTELRLRRY